MAIKETVLKFSDSCLNLSLRQKDHFISAFPGKIVFGKCNPLGYKKKEYFEFKIFDLYKLYLAIFDIIKYFSGDSILEKQLILSNQGFHYFFYVKMLTNENSEDFQVASFAIEHNNEIVFEVSFLDIEFNTFLYTLEKIIPLSMCLSAIENALFKKASKESAKIIHGFREDLNCTQFVKNFFNNNQDEIQDMEIKSIDCLSTFLNYYCEIILIFHKLQSVINNAENPFDNMAAVLSKQ